MIRSVGKLVVLMAVVLTATLYSSGTAVAQFGPASYIWEYDNVNIYRSEGLSFEFTSLTSTATYTWTLQLLDSNNNVVQTLANRSFTGATSTQIQFQDVDFPPDTFAPFRVIDNFGNVLSRNFLAPDPGIEWGDSNGNTDEDEKQSVGARRNVPGCVPPPYNDALINGWHHTGYACSVYTQTGSYTLLHYRSDIADYPSGDYIQFDMIAPGIADVFTVFIDDMIDYNASGHVSTFSLDDSQANKYVVLNTSGDLLPFINSALTALAFPADNNPHRASFGPGAYTCSRYDSSDIWISDCESVFLVGGDATGREFSLRFARSEVPPGTVQNRNTQRMLYGGVTSQIWSSYSNSYTFSDSQVGIISTQVATFTTGAEIAYLVDVPEAAIGNTAIGTWLIIPATLNTGLATSADMFLWGVDSTGFRPTYVIGDLDFAVDVEILLGALGLDNNAGQIMFFVGITLIGYGGFFFLRLPMWTYIIWYLMVGVLMVFTLNTSGLFNLIFTATSIMMIWAGVNQRRSATGEF